MIDRLILGDNPFLGVDHRSAAAGTRKAARLASPEAVRELFHAARRCGAGGVMLSSHARAAGILEAMREDKELWENFGVYPNIPYLMKYVSEVTRSGMAGTAARLFGSRSGHENLLNLLSGGWGVLRKDFKRIAQAAIDIELSAYKGARIRAVFLHNGLVDLALGLGLDEVFLFFDGYIRERYGAEAGFGTLNLTLLAERLERVGLKNAIVMAPFNMAGHFMHPSRQASEETVGRKDLRFLAMNTMAQGTIRPEEAFSYLGRFPNIRHAVIGASTREHIERSFGLAAEHLGGRS